MTRNQHKIEQRTELRSVAKGDYIKRTQSAAAVYIKGAYDRATKTFELLDTRDINRTIRLKSTTAVYVGFVY